MNVKKINIKKFYLFETKVPESLANDRLTATNLMNKEILEVCKDQFLL